MHFLLPFCLCLWLGMEGQEKMWSTCQINDKLFSNSRDELNQDKLILQELIEAGFSKGSEQLLVTPRNAEI